MAEQKKSNTRKDDENELRAGVSREEEREVKKISKEDADEEVLEEVAVEEPVVGLLTELPQNAIVANSTGNPETVNNEAMITATSLKVAEDVAPHFPDEFHGVGGSYVIDAETGERKRQYEEVRSPKGKVLGYRPLP